MRAVNSAVATLLIVAFCGEFAIAKPSKTRPKPSRAVASDPTTDKKPDEDVGVIPPSVQQMQERLYKVHRSKHARTLKQAYELAVKGQITKTKELVTPLRNNPLFSDYAYWIESKAELEHSQSLLKKRSFIEAARHADNASGLLLRIEPENPYSSLLKGLSKEIAGAELLAGDAYWAIKRWKSAKEKFERAFQRLSSAGGSAAAFVAVRPEHLSHYAEACTKIDGDLCSAWISRFSVVYPKGSEELRAVLKFFPAATDHGKPSGGGARSSLSYRAPDLDQVVMDNAMGFYIGGKYGQAAGAFQQLLENYPRSTHRFRARYWLGQAFVQDGEQESAKKVFEELQRDSPLTYYGLLSSFITGKSFGAMISATFPPARDVDPFLTPQEVMRLKRAQAFIAEGANSLAMLELRDFRGRDGISSPFLMYLALLNNEARNFVGGFQILGDVIQRGYEGVYSSFALHMIFPLAYLDLVQKYSAENNLDPILVLSLIKQESAFDPLAGSGAGALGLMQVMPSTALEVDPKVQRADLIDAEASIRIGTRYLRKMMSKFNGNIVLALAGYNAGPNAADRWFREAPAGRGMLEFIETIPYRETREYVSGVVRNYFWYSRKLNQESPKTPSYFWNLYGPPETPAEMTSAPSLLNSEIQRKPARSKK